MTDSEEKMNDSNLNESQKSEINSPSKPKTVNEIWKSLDIMFQAQLRAYQEKEDQSKFNALATELGFNETQIEFLLDSIGTFFNGAKHPLHIGHSPIPFHQYHSVPIQYQQPQQIPISFQQQHQNRPINNNNMLQPESSTSNSNATRHSKKSLYLAIPSYRNESLSGAHSGNKRKRDESDDDTDFDLDEDDDDSLKSPKRKKRKKSKTKTKNKKNKNKKKRGRGRPRKNGIRDEDESMDSLFDLDDDDEDEDEQLEMRQQELWGKDANLTAKQQKELESQDIYVVEEIQGHRGEGKKIEYNVKWQGYDDMTWEPFEHLPTYLVKQYWTEVGMKKDPEGCMLALQILNKLSPDDEINDDESVAVPTDDQDMDQDQDEDNDASTNTNTNTDTVIKSKSTPKKNKSKSKEKKKKKDKSLKKNSASKTKSPKKKKKILDDDGVQKEFRCEPCNRVFKNGQALGGHNAARHKRENKDQDESVKKDKKTKTKSKIKSKSKAKKKTVNKNKNKNEDGDSNSNKSAPYWEDSEDERDMIVLDDD